ncbi:MAG: deoxyribonuclease IV [Ruminococcaceae bacterium]|nr:deoxyribonuclease IV [Oscillospiraceae bacterium]
MFAVGCHLSTEGGYRSMGERILSVGGRTFQFFAKNPKGRTPVKPPEPEDIEGLCRIIRENGLLPPLAHAPYTYNPASEKESVREYSRDSMRKELEFLEVFDGAMYNFHPGCHVGQGVEQGIAYISDMLNAILWPEMKTTVLLETMAGKGTEIGRNFEELRAVIDAVRPEVRDCVGVCLDTCHVHDGGYPIGEDTDGVLDEFDRVIGLHRLRAVHLNDSMNPMGAAKDRHAKIGEGYIGMVGIARIVNHPALRKLPFYLETPNDLLGYGKEIALLKNVRNETEKGVSDNG